MIKAILFDFGDTLIREEKAQGGIIETVPHAYDILNQLASICATEFLVTFLSARS